MSIPKFSPRIAVLLLIIIAVAALRIASFSGVGPLALFSPVGAMALFSGAYFKGSWKPFVFPLLTLFLSDLFVSALIFPEFRSGLLYSGWEWTYLAFAIITLAGKYIVRNVNVKNVVIAVVSATFIHWIVSDIGMCVMENKFTWSLYGQKLVDAIPFELRFMSGTALFSALMFGGFELLQKKFPKLAFG